MGWVTQEESSAAAVVCHVHSQQLEDLGSVHVETLGVAAVLKLKKKKLILFRYSRGGFHLPPNELCVSLYLLDWIVEGKYPISGLLHVATGMFSISVMNVTRRVHVVIAYR